MAGYSQMNQGYGEQPGVNWGKIAAYTGGGIMAAGVVRMGAHKLNTSTLGARQKGMRGARRAGAGIKSGAGWVKNQTYGRMGGWEGIKSGASAIWGGIHRKGAMGYYQRAGGRSARDLQERLRYQQTLAKGSGSIKSANRIGKMRGMLPSGQNISALSRPGRGTMGQRAMHLGKQAGYAAAGYFGGAGFSGLKRAGVIGGRAGMVGAGIAALDFINPFGFGWND